MPRIEWNDSFSVNNTELDDQHKQWINIHNKLHEMLINGKPGDLGSMQADALQSMQDYAEYHFAAEEEYLDKIGYPDFAMHRRLHDDFETKIYQYNRDIRDGERILNTEIMKELENWLLNHILVEDRKYCQFAAER